MTTATDLMQIVRIFFVALNQNEAEKNNCCCSKAHQGRGVMKKEVKK